MKKLIAVSGSNSGDKNLDRRILQLAEEVGLLIAKNGGILVCGGLGGIMEASAKGAKKGGGLTVGILPWEKEKANRYIDVPIATGLGFFRNNLIVNCADCVISVCGRWGTLNEVAMSMGLGKKTVILSISKGISEMLSKKDILEKFKTQPIIAQSPEEAVKFAFAA